MHVTSLQDTRRGIAALSKELEHVSASSFVLNSKLNRLYSFKNIQLPFNYSVLYKQALKVLAKSYSPN
jgi:hypothetical protein